MSSSTTSWTEVPLNEACEINPRDPGPADPLSQVSFIPMPAVSDSKGVILEHGTRAFAEVAKGYTRFRDGDVIFAKITPCMENGKIAIARDLHNGVACGSTEFHVLRARACILPSYLWHFLRQTNFRAEAERNMTGAVGQRRVPVRFLQNSIIPLPPIDEQERIVRKLEHMLHRSQNARTELHHVPKLVGRYKQAVLGAAFRGDLTAVWRSANNVTLEGTWQKKLLGDLAPDISYGTAAKCHYEPRTTPVLRIPNVSGGQIDIRDLKYGVFEAGEISKLSLKQGDLLVIRSNGSLDLVGRVAVVDERAVGYLFAGYLIRLRLDETKALPAFVAFAFEEPLIRSTVERFAKSTSGVNNINSEQLRSLEIPLPPIVEQRQIVRRVHAAFSQIHTLLAEATRALGLLDRLDQAILAKAFRGELVADAPSPSGPATVGTMGQDFKTVPGGRQRISA